eukprot:TRINITY_DN13183_c0_g1_i2.p1 TRINITY_DN13183_c0_g1~~TRINITY_DN13183_c0_g1_i2.p1  ORF type:complete len:166 (-),score=50.50 TRINITY_DN13183_c0_g1_i2:70-567(-)
MCIRDRDKGSSKDLLPILTKKILNKKHLNNPHIISLFKLYKIKLDDKPNEYKNLLRAMGALYYANMGMEWVKGSFNVWKEATLQKIKDREERVEEFENVEEVSEKQKEISQDRDFEDEIVQELSLIHISEPTRPLYISYAVFCLKKKKKKTQKTTTHKTIQHHNT